MSEQEHKHVETFNSGLGHNQNHRAKTKQASNGSRLSLWHLMMLMTTIALGIAVGLAIRRNFLLTRERDQLLALSVGIASPTESGWDSRALPTVASQFYSWQVDVPADQAYELRLGVGTISQKQIPPIVGSVPISPGEHRITFCSRTSYNEDNHFVVYLDGQVAIEKTMGKEWMPHGWSSARGFNWPSYKQYPGAHQLAAQGYIPRHDFGKQVYFHGDTDEFSSHVGYRLWIDKVGREYAPASPFVGFPDETPFYGMGLRDGLRFVLRAVSAPLSLHCPALETTIPVLQIECEFLTGDEVVPSTGRAVVRWQISGSPTTQTAVAWRDDPTETSHEAFLHAGLLNSPGLQPVIQLKWDRNLPDSIGLRLADVPGNDKLSRWRLRFPNGLAHLWRHLQIDDGPSISAANARELNADQSEPSTIGNKTSVAIDLGNSPERTFNLNWQTDETLPLQILQRSDQRYANLSLYHGLPVTMGLEIPATSKPKLTVNVAGQSAVVPGSPPPTPPIFGAIQIELDGAQRDWIWLKVKRQ